MREGEGHLSGRREVRLPEIVPGIPAKPHQAMLFLACPRLAAGRQRSSCRRWGGGSITTYGGATPIRGLRRIEVRVASDARLLGSGRRSPPRLVPPPLFAEPALARLVLAPLLGCWTPWRCRVCHVRARPQRHSTTGPAPMRPKPVSHHRCLSASPPLRQRPESPPSPSGAHAIGPAHM